MTSERQDDPVQIPPDVKEPALSDTLASSVITEMASSPSTKPSTKKNFFIKVYVTLILQLSVSLVVCLLGVMVKKVRMFMLLNAWTGVIALILFAVSIFLLLLCQDMFSFPYNAIYLTVLGFLGTWPLAIIAVNYDSIAIVSALGITIMIALITTIIAAVIPCAVSSRTLIFIFVIIIMAVTTSTISMIAYFVRFKIVHLIFSSLTAVAASIYYFFMTLFVMKNIYKVPSDWIFANLALYTTIPGLLVHSLVVLAIGNQGYICSRARFDEDIHLKTEMCDKSFQYREESVAVLKKKGPAGPGTMVFQPIVRSVAAHPGTPIQLPGLPGANN